MQQIITRNARRIKQISVTDLFGIFNHTIPLNMDDRITIIKGPNGFGKTVILKLLSELFGNDDLMILFEKKEAALFTTPFADFRVDFDDNSSLRLVKTAKSSDSVVDEEEKLIPQNITFLYKSAEGQEESFDFIPPPPFATLPRLYFGKTPRSILKNDFGKDDPGKILSSIAFSLGSSPSFEGSALEEIELVQSDPQYNAGRTSAILKELRNSLSQRRQEEPDWLKELRGSVSIHFIETQRLLNLIKSNNWNNQSSMKPTVEAYAEHLIGEIKTKLAESAELSQSLDRTFPRRVINSIGDKKGITPQELTDRLNQLVEKRAHLMKVGFLDKNVDNDFIENEVHDERTIDVLTIYVEDTEKKLEIFKDIADKIDLMTRIIDKHFLYKKMIISKEKGFVFRTSRDTVLSPSDLSSGEQHELVLLYELLFRVKSGSLILIDEPELSLHVVWQMEFLQDLQEVTRLAGLEVLMATHSPDIVDKWDHLTIHLKEPE